MPVIKRALLSVSDKTGIEVFARGLVELGVEILSTGGTAAQLARAGVPIVEVSDYTGFPEMMDGRVKTLHPKIHGGLLGRRGIDDPVMRTHGIEPIDLLVVNLYPFQETIADPVCTFERAIENIDIGGPTLVRAAAKNHAAVTVVVDSADYDLVLAQMRERAGAVSDETRFRLALKAFEHTAQYDGAIANYLGTFSADRSQRTRFPHACHFQFLKVQDLRYGENPHQAAAFYREATPPPASIAGALQRQGKPLSFNNIADADAAWECVKAVGEQSACVIVKHANPCGAAIGPDITAAYERAYACDPTSAFGGIIALNRPLDTRTAAAVLERQFVEVIVAPSVHDEALAALAAKPNVRVLCTGPSDGGETPGTLDLTRVTGGLLVQDRDIRRVTREELRCMTRQRPTDAQLDDLLFAWEIAKHVKSNAIVYARGGQTLGIGAGQMSRVDSTRIAAIKAEEAGLALRGAVLASDAFFPFADAVEHAAEAGVAAIIQPGGSMRDNEVIAAADAHGIAMVFTGVRHFRH